MKTRITMMLAVLACCACAIGADIVVRDGKTFVRSGSLGKDSYVLADVETMGDATNISEFVVSEFNRTNLTERIGAKQDSIADLDAIREGAAKGDTALQSESDPTVGLTNGTIYVKGESVTPVTHGDLSGLASKSELASATNGLRGTLDMNAYSEVADGAWTVSAPAARPPLSYVPVGSPAYSNGRWSITVDCYASGVKVDSYACLSQPMPSAEVGSSISFTDARGVIPGFTATRPMKRVVSGRLATESYADSRDSSNLTAAVAHSDANLASANETARTLAAETLRAANQYTDEHSGGGGGGGASFSAVTNIAYGVSSNVLEKSLVSEGRMLPKYLHEMSFDDSYPEAAAMYYARHEAAGGCSAVRSGGFLYRNFDYPFDERAEFVVRMSAGKDRFASVGVAQVGENLTESFVCSHRPSVWYKALPGATVDGINENGVCAEINVVDGDPWASGWATNETASAVHPLAAVRWALDHATNAQHAATYLAANIRFPEGWTQNFHWMIADESSTYIVENGEALDADEYHEPDEPATMTNFPLNRFPWEGMGMERFGLLLYGGNITNAWYTRAYRRETTPPWVTDLADVIAYTNDIFDAWASHPKEYFRNKTNGGEPWWQTVHTSIYDITNRTLRIAVQETDDWYVFQVPSSGSSVDVYTKSETEQKIRELVPPSETDPVWGNDRPWYVRWTNPNHNALTVGSRQTGSRVGENSFVNGQSAVAGALFSHAEGAYTKANGNYSHAEGYYSEAVGYYTHAEGGNTHADGDSTHAEGNATTALGFGSHAEGGETTAGKSSQVDGMYAHAAGFNANARSTTSFTWNGSQFNHPSSRSDSDAYVPPYSDHGNGTYNINPVGGLYGFWIGETNLGSVLDGIEEMPDNGVVLTNGVLKTKGGTAIAAGNVGAATPGEVQTAIENAGHATSAELERVSSKATFASNGVDRIEANTNIVFSIDGSVLTISTNGVAIWRSYSASPGPRPTLEKRYAMFVIPLNDTAYQSGANHFTQFELKASTNNFSTAYSQNARCCFYSHSGHADGEYSTNDRMHLFLNHGGADHRSYVRIPNTLEGMPNYAPSEVVVLVDAALMNLDRSDGSWLYESNEDVNWTWVRTKNGEREVDPGTDHCLWRPISPVRWFYALPVWAR